MAQQEPRKITHFFSRINSHQCDDSSTKSESDDSDWNHSRPEPDEVPPVPKKKRVDETEPDAVPPLAVALAPVPKKKRVELKKFVPGWTQTFPWLQYDEANKSMSCKICRLNGRTGVWVDRTRNFRLKSITQHLSSNGHQFSVAATDETQTSLDRSKSQRDEAFLTAMQTAFWIINEEVANRKYKSLLEFLQPLGVKGAQYLNHAANAQYTSPHIFNQLLDALSKVIMDDLKTAMKRSPTIGIGIDESTDRSQEKHIAVIVRYVAKDGKIVTTFLKLNAIRDGKAQSLFESLTSVLQEFEVPYTKVVGLGADGVNVISSVVNGLNGLVKVQNPFCIYVHCVCHRLALAVHSCSQTIPALNTLTKIISAVYNYVQYSKLEQFKDISAVLNLESVKFKRLYEIRWLCLGEAVVAVTRNYEALMVLLSQDARNGDPVAIGLNQQLSSFKYVALLHLVADILNIVNHLSRLFQYRDVSFAAIRIELQDCLATITEMVNQDGPHLTNFLTSLTADSIFKTVTISTNPRRGEPIDQRETFRRIRQEILTTLHDNIRDRFPRVEILEAMQVFEPAAYPVAQDRLVAWGNQYLETILNHFGQQQTNHEGRRFNQLVDHDRCRGEFLPFKRLIHRNLGENHTEDGNQVFHYFRPTELMEKLFNSVDRYGNRNIYPELFKLMSLSLCIMVGNAEAERVFSCQNRIKSKLRTRLTVEHLDQLIRISYATARNFPFNTAVQHFQRRQQRRL